MCVCVCVYIYICSTDQCQIKMRLLLPETNMENERVKVKFCSKRVKAKNLCVTPSFKTKIEYIHLCMPGSSFTHKVTNSEINSINSIYYIKS
jgi:hypothetical protein